MTRSDRDLDRSLGRSHASALTKLELLRSELVGDNVVLEQELCESHLHLQHGESHSDAAARSKTKGHVDGRMTFDMRLKSERIELVHVLAPVLGVEMKRQYINDDGEVLGKLDAIDLACFCASSGNNTLILQDKNISIDETKIRTIIDMNLQVGR